MFGITPFERNDFWSPFREFEKEFFKGFAPVSQFRTDIKDEGGSYIMECELPGFDKDEIKIDIDGDTLTLRAERKSGNEEKNDNGYIRRERSYGCYKRSFDLSNINSDAIDASYTNGILKLTLPKKEKVQPEVRRIEIK